MSSQRFKTKYPGVFYRLHTVRNKQEKIFYIIYRRVGEKKLFEEAIGHEFTGMTAATANKIRSLRITKKELSNTEKRALEKQQLKKTNITLQKLWDFYLEINSNKRSLKQDISRYQYLYKFYKKNPEDISTIDIDGLKKTLFSAKSKGPRNKGNPLTLATIKQVLDLLQNLINFGVKRNLCAKPKNLYIEFLKIDNQVTEMLSNSQIQKLLSVLKEKKYRKYAAMLKLALSTGMRKSAILALKWDDCDFEHKSIRLSGSSAKKGITTYIPMNDFTRTILLSIPKKDSKYIFPGRGNNPLSDCSWKVLRTLKEEVGLPKNFRPFHGLRHTFASKLASSGRVDLYTLQRLLTHETPAMTQRYAHLHDEALKRASAVINDMLSCFPAKV